MTIILSFSNTSCHRHFCDPRQRRAELNYWLQDLGSLRQLEYEFQVNNIKEIKQNSDTAFE